MVARLLFDLNRNDCHWPVGTDDESSLTLLCGEPAKAGGPYCRCHVRLAFSPRPPRRSRSKRAAARYVPEREVAMAFQAPRVDRLTRNVGAVGSDGK
jgi:hypothetical protein